ncbi:MULTISPECIES: 50S ribosomal protein L13 [Anaerococcus]|uniref:Large ribosomal subunit protein uL13 n=1 Tax=Anaerococcus octavius TaxID=54007 RepID=A0A2I1MAQ9_9FIRM|nr:MULTISPECIES: 50S ribosomal protein L13 [Anaerococcus]MBS6105552.1 50S ribosomal protein L13 [Anaerococcus sp.]MDU2598354.1 50S ribosomal protein L13 [Anaerococcus sp.]MDU3176578.1 50S ribosomal protein L13 [Anaerococcus sp.]MDU7411212.1 50S ribosomal protein L13 [Anaerococcus sp.]PKZ17211.1 50S ribosomal protein L13 [Anaerococcus octavius]
MKYQKTYTPSANDIERKWYVVDAEGVVLGRLASEVAAILRGKHKATFTPNMDMGDYVIVVNADKVRLTGNKENQKEYKRYSGYAGGLKITSYKDMMDKHPERIVEHAVVGMLPHNKLGRQMAKKLRVVVGPDHNHEAQMPEKLELK